MDAKDRELLELAAKAAGIRIEPVVMRNVRELGDEEFIGYRADPDQCQSGWFNPLTDDGEALRLAVNLRLVMHVWHEDAAVSVAKTLADGDDPSDSDAESWTFEKDYSPTENARRAIVRAAAKIGRAM